MIRNARPYVTPTARAVSVGKFRSFLTYIGFCNAIMWRIALLPLLILNLPGCDGGSPHFMGIEPTRVEVEGSVFAVRVKGRLAKAVRINPQYAPRMGPIGGRAATAMEQVSGCTVREIRGDQALILGILDC